ncbi:coiled-coil domain-containing protein 181 isoform X2 [Tyto alba]|uniref:coiled-coil domain-containing protein 181 isoform X2 n=1 Tax=Tyto alba TaxID=56313 RepID=UPI001C684A65|nr:coiled-coil domain-containing protein 181 isoform X2 [Tyto alba]
MSEKENQGDPADMGDLTESGEYEDDFEKDLDWLINEEEKENLGEIENPEKNEENIEAQIVKVVDNFEEDNEEMEENPNQLSEADVDVKARPSNEENLESSSDIKQGDRVSDTDSESSLQESKLEKQQELDEEEDEEIKRYILEKIEEANKLLENQAPVDQNRERKLKFKDKLVDLEVPPLEDAEICKTDLARGDDVSNRLSRLHISNEMGQESTSLSPRAGKDEEKKDGKILVEKDGKFELLSLCDIESQGFLPPISVSFTDIETQQMSPKSSHYGPFGTVSRMKEVPPVRPGAHSFSPGGEERVYFPKPPSNPKRRPNSAISAARGLGKRKTPQRAQSANVPVRSSTYCLSPRQKELRKQLEQRKEKLRKEERSRNPEEAFKLWLKKKHQEHMKEKQIEILRRQAEGIAFFPRTEECNRAFKEWLKRKREEKRAEELAAKERARQFRLEARRAKQMQNIHCISSETKSFRFTDHYS